MLIVSQGRRPICHPYISTGAEEYVITELGGRSPLQRLREIVEGLPRGEQEAVSRGVQIGIVTDERLAAPGQGDFIIRGLLATDPVSGRSRPGRLSWLAQRCSSRFLTR